MAEENRSVVGLEKYPDVVDNKNVFNVAQENITTVAGKKVLSLEGVAEVVRKMKRSGLSMWAFAKREDIPYSSLRSYCARLRRDAPDNMLELKSSNSQNKTNGFVQLVPEEHQVSGKCSGESFSLHCSGFHLEFPLSSLSLVLAELKNHA